MQRFAPKVPPYLSAVKPDRPAAALASKGLSPGPLLRCGGLRLGRGQRKIRYKTEVQMGGRGVGRSRLGATDEDGIGG